MVYAKYHIAMLGLQIDFWRHKPISHLIHGWTPDDLGLRLVRSVRFKMPGEPDPEPGDESDLEIEPPPPTTSAPAASTDSEMVDAEDTMEEDAPMIFAKPDISGVPVPVERLPSGKAFTYWVACRRTKDNKWVGKEQYQKAQAVAWILNYHHILRLNGLKAHPHGAEIDWVAGRKAADAKAKAEKDLAKQELQAPSTAKPKGKRKAKAGTSTEPATQPRNKKSGSKDESPLPLPSGRQNRRTVRRQYRRMIKALQEDEIAVKTEMKSEDSSHVTTPSQPQPTTPKIPSPPAPRTYTPPSSQAFQAGLDRLNAESASQGVDPTQIQDQVEVLGTQDGAPPRPALRFSPAPTSKSKGKGRALTNDDGEEEKPRDGQEEDEKVDAEPKDDGDAQDAKPDINDEDGEDPDGPVETGLLYDDDNDSAWSIDSDELPEVRQAMGPPPDYIDSEYDIPNPFDFSTAMQTKYVQRGAVWRTVFNRWVWTPLRSYMIHQANEAALLPLSYWAQLPKKDEMSDVVCEISVGM